MEGLHKNFGLVIAFVLPGLVGLLGLSYFSPTLSAWLATTPERAPSIGSFLYLALGSLAVGLIVSALRWFVVDSLHHRTGLAYPDFDFTRLQQNLDAFAMSVEWYYRYYQFYANMFVAILGLVGCQLITGELHSFGRWTGIIVVEGVLFFASRDSLGRYYTRVSHLLGTRQKSPPTEPVSGPPSGEASSGTSGHEPNNDTLPS